MPVNFWDGFIIIGPSGIMLLAVPRRWPQSAHDPIHGSPCFEFRPRRLSIEEAWLL